jgi:hypothetical protein
MINRLISIALCVIVLGFTANAQSAEALDKKYGFNIFRLGSSFKDVSKLAKLKKVNEANRERNFVRYTIKEVGEYHLFDYELKKIDLIFYKDLLLEIQVHLPNYYVSTKDRWQMMAKDIFKNIEGQYGQFQARELSTKDKLANIAEIGQIVGKQTTLLFFDFNPTYNTTNYMGMYYAFISTSVYNMQISDNKKGSGL